MALATSTSPSRAPTQVALSDAHPSPSLLARRWELQTARAVGRLPGPVPTRRQRHIVREPKSARERRSEALDPGTVEVLKRQASQQLADQA